MIPVAIVLAFASTMRGPQATPVPWAVGETFEYGARWSIFSPGSATMKVIGVDTVRGAPSWHFALALNVSFALFHQHTEMSSWTGVADFISRRMTKVLDEKDVKRNDDFSIFADSGFYRNRGDTARHRTPHDALDDIAFVYYLRTIPLKVGAHYEFPRYFRDDKNPVIVDVERKEIVELPDGSRVQCIVIHPIVNEPHGMFDKDHDARIWLTDDGRRVPVKIRSSYPAAGQIFLNIRKITMPLSPSR